MLLLDRYILVRFLANFATLFLLLYIFAVAIDVIVSLDDFVEAAQLKAGEGGGMLRLVVALIGVVADFQLPRIFQFYAYLHGLVAIGAMGFTLAQMHRYRELVAVMASGVSLYRVAMPFIAAVFGLSVLQILNQELILPRVAPLVLRENHQIGQHGMDTFKIRFTPDGKGSLWQAPSYNPTSHTLISPTILERDELGRTTRRVTATEANWSEVDKAWVLTNGRAITRIVGEDQSPQPMLTENIGSYPTDLTPHVLMVRRFNQYATMLSLDQIGQMLDSPALQGRETLLRYRYSRFSAALVNVLVMVLALPTFLLREPANLLRQTVLCASLALPASLGAAIGMMVDMPGLPPAVGVFLPVIILGFMSLFPWTNFKT